MVNLITETQRMQKLAGIQEDVPPPSDVRNLAKAQQSATSVQGKAKNINNIAEFEGAFETWLSTLGLEAGKGGATKMGIKNAVDRVLVKKGYK